MNIFDWYTYLEPFRPSSFSVWQFMSEEECCFPFFPFNFVFFVLWVQRIWIIHTYLTQIPRHHTHYITQVLILDSTRITSIISLIITFFNNFEHRIEWTKNISCLLSPLNRQTYWNTVNKRMKKEEEGKNNIIN